MTRIIIVRHGQTTWNVEMRYQGHSDIELTDLGLDQARKAAKRLAHLPISAVYASDLQRAFVTAEQIALPHNLPVKALPSLRELSFGIWEGLTYDGLNSEWAAMMDRLFTHPDEVEIPGGETFRQLKARVTQAVDSLVEQHPDETIVIVSHGGTIRTLLSAVLQMPLNAVWNIKQDNTAVNIIDYAAGQAYVSLVNDTHHLTATE